MIKHDRVAQLAISLSLASLLTAAPIALQAQAANNIQFGLAAGASFPVGDFGNGTDVGYNLGVSLGMKQPTSPLGFRVEGVYNEWAISGLRDAKVHAGGVVANATYDIPLGVSTRSSTPGNTLYGIGGLGWYGTGGGGTHLGWNIGGGLKFPLTNFSAYIEARYNSISDGDIKFVPVTFGLIF